MHRRIDFIAPQRMPRGSLLLGQRQEMPTGDLRTCRLTSKSSLAGLKKEFGERPEKIGSDSSECPLSQAFRACCRRSCRISLLFAFLLCVLLWFSLHVLFVLCCFHCLAKCKDYEWDKNSRGEELQEVKSFKRPVSITQRQRSPQIHYPQAWLCDTCKTTSM